jgi:hypothetical protein
MIAASRGLWEHALPWMIGNSVLPSARLYNNCSANQTGAAQAQGFLMQHLHPIHEDEMVAVFLATEIASSRFSSAILAILQRDRQERQIIDQPDFANQVDTAYRRHVLSEWRGYRRDADVFKGFPTNVRWYRALATMADLEQLRYINDAYWIELSGGSRLVMDAVARIRHGIEAFWVSNAGVWFMAKALCAGAVFPELILVGKDERSRLVVPEGHVRLTAYLLRPDCTPSTVPVLVGYSPHLDK